MRHFFFAAFFLSSSFAFCADKQFDSRTNEGSVQFEATASPGNLKIEGKVPSDKAKAFQWVFRQKEGKLHFVSKFQVDSWDTGLTLRNSHLRDKYLEAEKFPEARVKLDPIALPAPGDRKLASSAMPFTGELQLHGQTKKIKGEMQMKTAGKNTELIFNFPVKLTDYKIQVPSFMGVSVGEEIKVTAKFSLPL